MDGSGLRERKKARTRRQIADTAARLFGRYGYEQVTVGDVAREAEVSEQTVYNYFPTKQQLVLDRDDEIRGRLAELVRDREPGASPVAAVREVVDDDLEHLGAMSADQARGNLAALAAVSPTIRRLALEAADRQADAVAAALVDTTPDLKPLTAKVHAVTLVWVFQMIIDESGRRGRDGQSPSEIVDGLRPLVEDLLDDLDRRFGAPVTG